MKITDIITEAASPAQQAAIAISMKKAGKKPKQGVAEGWPGELAGGTIGGIAGNLVGSAVGGPIGGVVGGAVGGAGGGIIGRELTKEEQLNEFAPILAAGARLVITMAPKIAQVLKSTGKATAKAAAPVAKSGAEIAAKNAGQIGVGLGAYEIGSSVADIAKDITAKVGTALEEKTVMELAQVAFKFAIPAGIVLAILYGGKKVIDSLFSNSNPQQGVAEEASPMIKPPANRFDNKQEAFDYAKEHGGKVFKSTYIDPNTGIKNIIFVVKKEQGVAEGLESDAYGNTGEKHECGSCDGTGIDTHDDVCPECGGKGWVRDKESSKKKGVAEGILGSDPNRGQKVPDWAKGGIVGKIGRHLDPAWSDVQRTVPKHLLAKQPGAAATNAPTTKDTPKSTSATPTRAIPKSTGPKPSQPVTKNVVKTIADKQGVAEDTELAEEFDLIESIVEMIAEHNGVDAEVVWADLESLTEDELYVFAVTSNPLMEDWQKANKRDKTDGMSQKAVNAYRRENPGSKLKTAVTTKPGKLKKGGKASKRRKSYCSRSRGQMKMHSISCAKTPDKAICKARRRWNC